MIRVSKSESDVLLNERKRIFFFLSWLWFQNHRSVYSLKKEKLSSSSLYSSDFKITERYTLLPHPMARSRNHRKMT